ncbi:MAG: hypothetical protein KGH55_02795 [Nanoarchaeota archaeon]|nr:hypothetical protein [Nanoarchaeota archaeon]
MEYISLEQVLLTLGAGVVLSGALSFVSCYLLPRSLDAIEDYVSNQKYLNRMKKEELSLIPQYRGS